MASWAAIIMAALQVIGGIVSGSHKVHKHRKHNRKKAQVECKHNESKDFSTYS